MATELHLTPQHRTPSTITVKFVGSLDATNLEDAEKLILEQAIPGTTKAMVFDFAELDYLNSKAVGFLVNLSQKLAASNITLVLSALKPNVEDIITIVGLDQIIPVTKTVDDGVALGESGEAPRI